ncbi:purine nucleosidase [Enterococcus sp. DIV2402]|uniref:Purine nucleosidase n=1 Tax=Candidatus Enterococcus lowellii TaxID=2230877 RepID=A0ABZ2ST96_9ENTE|nr:nucleoside hydrolase [Enterococcus sp. DIV2402]MBO0462934.1 nucleoside hydrolase [Enterococcus sp. DIV2402]
MQRQKVIIDCDPGIDDMLALMLAVQAPELEVVGITVVCGNVPVELGVENTFRCLERCHRLDIPVYQGATTPLTREFISAQDTHGMDGLGETYFPRTSEKTIEVQDAATYLATTFAQPTAISVIALGPLTNIAQALQKNPQLGEHMQRFVSMGGTYKSHGNCSPVAEYNYWCDPDAAAYVFQHLNQTIEMVGLDVTREIVLTPTLIEYCRRMNPEIGQFIQAITRFYVDFHWQQEHILGCVINDPLAVAYFIDPTICTGFESFTAVETTSISMGQTLVDRYDFWQKPANSKILTEVDTYSFFGKFLTVILHAQEELIQTDLKNLM